MTHDPRIGQDFGDYIITKKLAEGGMGAVYLAEHSSGMRKVVKFMLAECLQHPGVRQRFETECMAAKRLKGRSGIVEIDSFGVRNGEMYLVMEFIDGVTLDAHIRQNVRLTAHHTFHIAAQILRALDALHREGIIHRDLKPSNVFLRHTEDRAWDVKLIDFGIVHDKQSTTSTEFRTREGMMIGTPGYMATEQYGRADKVTAATDVFACAVMIWEMLTGELPWGVAENEFAQHNRQLNQTPTWPAHLVVPHANNWPALLVPALVPEPSQRPQSAQAFALLLAECLEAVPPHVPSGLEMVQTLAPRFLLSAPHDLETIRQSGPLPASISWPPRAVSGAPVVSSPSLDAIPVSAVSAAPNPTPAFAPTVNARPAPSAPSANMAAGPMTTLSALNGSSVASASPRASRSKLVAIGAATALAVAGVTFGVSRMSGKSSSGSDASEPRPVSPQAPAASPANAGTAPLGTSPDRSREQPAPQAPSAPTNVATPSGAPSTPATPTETVPPASPSQAKKRPTSKEGSSGTSTVKKGVTTLASPEKKGGTTPGTSPSTTPGAGSGSATRANGSAYDPDAIKE